MFFFSVSNTMSMSALQPQIVKAMKPKHGKDWILVRGDTVFVRFLAQNDDGNFFEVQTPTRPEERIHIGGVDYRIQAASRPEAPFFGR